MIQSERHRYIARVTLFFLLLAGLWIAISDRLLWTADRGELIWLSMTKGMAFVLVTTLLLFFGMRGVPETRATPAERIPADDRFSRWAMYGGAAAISLAMVVLRHAIPAPFQDRPLLIVFMFPVILSGVLGGLGPGLLATAIVTAASFGSAFPAVDEPGFTAVDLFHWCFLIANGVLVSILSERLHRSQRRAIALRDADRNFRVLFESAAATITVHDSETGAIVAANHRAIESKGYASLAELQTNGCWSDPPYALEDAMIHIRKAVSAGTQRFEWRGRSPDGRTYWDDVQLKLVVLDGIERVVAIAVDITDRKIAEAEKHRLDQALHQTSHPFMLTTPDVRITYINPAFTRVMGYRADELVGQPVQCLCADSDDCRRQQAEAIAHVRAHGGWSGEVPRKAKDGTIIPVYATINLIRSAEGEVIGFGGDLLDLRPLKQKEDELRRQEAELRRRNDELERMNRFMVGRELDMIALKRQVNQLSRELGRAAPYPLALVDQVPTGSLAGS